MPKKQIPTLTARKPDTRKKPIAITIDPAILEQLDQRGDNRSEQIRMDLSRYYRLLAEARGRLRTLLTPAELSAIIDIQNGHWYHERLDLAEITANVADGCRLEGLDKKWNIDGSALLDKLRTLDLLSVHALTDATQRFWHAVGEGDHTRDPARALD